MKFIGQVPASKSLMNRALIVKSFYPELELVGQSLSDDVKWMSEAVDSLNSGKTEFYCGDAGTVLRFLVPRLARQTGHFTLRGTRRLFERPQQPLVALLGQLGCLDIELSEDRLSFRSEGWKVAGDAIHFHFTQSSQFISGLLLSCWDLPTPMAFSVPRDLKSYGYFDMTLRLAKSLGMNVQISGDEVFIPADQKISVTKYVVEPDMSSCFALAAAATLGGEARFTDFPEKSLQPDFCFQGILECMEVQIDERWKWTRFLKTKTIYPVDVDLEDAPDLFPVLAVLCAFAQGRSRLYGAPQLAHKESNRIKKVAELLSHLGIPFSEHEDGIEIVGPTQVKLIPEFVFDPDHDHRMAMAAGVLKKAGVPVRILHPEVVAKSFPEFFDILGVAP